MYSRDGPTRQETRSVDSVADDPDGGPVPWELLSGLRDGLLDAATAARLRDCAATDPRVADRLAALDRVSRELAAFAADAETASHVPGDVTDRIDRALRSRRPLGRRRWRRFDRS